MVSKKRGAKKGGTELRSVKKRKAVESGDYGGADDLFFDAEDDRKSSDSEEEEEVFETAEEKRLKLAKQYLEELKGDVEEEGESGSEDGEDVQMLIAKRLKDDSDASKFWVEREMADKIRLPVGGIQNNGKLHSRAHRLSVTGVAATADDRTAYSVSKCGMIFKWDLETGKRHRIKFGPDARNVKPTGITAEWVKTRGRQAPKNALLAVSVSSDGQYLAVGGGDYHVHVFDARSETHIKAFPGHRDIVSGLAFRSDTHELYSSSFDRTVKCWSLDDLGYVDTLFGHHAEVFSIDMLKQERAITSGADRSCHLWKIPESSQLIFRAPSMMTDCCRYVNPTTFVSGGQKGLQLWSHTKKKPISVVENAHTNAKGGPGGLNVLEASWVQSLGTCRGSDVVVSGAGDGLIRLWSIKKQEKLHKLNELGGLAARGFVNALHVSRDCRVVVGGVGQEPRLGRWCRDNCAKNGVIIYRLEMAD